MLHALRSRIKLYLPPLPHHSQLSSTSYPLTSHLPYHLHYYLHTISISSTKQMDRDCGQMKATWKCSIMTTKDALILVQRCIEGKMQPITRRPHDRERSELVQSGNCFVYTENGSGIKRWTDGINWSPSRILNNFLVYRELDKAFPPGEKKKATKRAKRYSPYDRPSPNRHHQQQIPQEVVRVAGSSRTLSKDEERLLVGSLNESYCFKENGLIKKTISVSYDNNIWHVVWYYSYFAFLEEREKFQRPEHTWPNTTLLPELINDQNFRCPLNPDGSEMTGSARERQGHETSLSPAADLTHYQQNNQLNRYTTLTGPTPGYTLPIMHASQYFPTTRASQEQHYQTSSSYSVKPEVDNSALYHQQPRYSSHEYSIPPTEYTFAQAGDLPSSVRFNSMYGSGGYQSMQSSTQHNVQSIHMPTTIARSNNTTSPYRPNGGIQQYQHQPTTHIDYDSRLMSSSGVHGAFAGLASPGSQSGNVRSSNNGTLEGIQDNLDQRYSWTR